MRVSHTHTPLAPSWHIVQLWGQQWVPAPEPGQVTLLIMVQVMLLG